MHFAEKWKRVYRARDLSVRIQIDILKTMVWHTQRFFHNLPAHSNRRWLEGYEIDFKKDVFGSKWLLSNAGRGGAPGGGQKLHYNNNVTMTTPASPTAHSPSTERDLHCEFSTRHKRKLWRWHKLKKGEKEKKRKKRGERERKVVYIITMRPKNTISTTY